MKTVNIIFSNPQFNYKTSVSEKATAESIKDYFVDKYFNVGVYPIENMQKCINVEIVNLKK